MLEGSTPIGSGGWWEKHSVLIMADVVESMELMNHDEWSQARRIRDTLHRLAQHIVRRFTGAQLLEVRGDGLLIRLDSVQDALEIAALSHDFVLIERRESGHPVALALRIGLHADRLLGDGVHWIGRGLSLTSRVCALARPRETLLTQAVAQQLPPACQADLRDLGDCYFKHATEPIRVYGVGLDTQPPIGPPPPWPNPVDTRTSVALIPLDVDGLDAGTQAVANLFIDSLTCRLSGSPELRIISQFSSARAKSLNPDPIRLAKNLGVRFLLVGRLSATTERFLVHLELIDSTGADVIWAGQVQESVGSLLVPHSAPIESAAYRIHAALLDGQLANLRYKPLPNLNSHDLQRAAVLLMHQANKQDFDCAWQMLTHLCERHPRSAVPRSWLAKWHILKVAQGWSDSTARDIACAGQDADRALNMDPDNALCATILGMVHGYLRHEFGAAGTHYQQALRTNPNEAQAHLQAGALAGWQGRSQLALHHSAEALGRAPLDPHLYYFYCLSAAAHLGAGDHCTAEQHAQSSLSLNKSHIATYKILMLAQGLQGKLPSARATAAQLLVLSPEFSVAHFARHSPWGEHPRVADFRQVLSEAGIPSITP